MSKTFGQILKQIRKEQGLTSNEMAKILGIPQSTYSKYETDKMKKVDWKILQKVNAMANMDITQYEDVTTFMQCKVQLIEKLMLYNEALNEIESLQNYLKQLEISEEENCFKLIYHENEYIISKKGFQGTITLYSIVASFISELLSAIKDEIVKNEFNEVLIFAYTQYAKLRDEIFTK